MPCSMYRLAASAAIAAPLLLGVAHAQTSTTVQDTAVDPSLETMQVDTPTFIQSATSSNQFEILSSRLALEQADDDQVKQFAQQMIDDHTKAGDRMAEAIQAAGLQAPPMQQDSMLDRHKQMLDTLAANEETFDEAYVRAQYQAHQEAVRLFDMYAREGDTEEIRTAAEELLPALQQHLAMVQELPGAPEGASAPPTGATGGMNQGTTGGAEAPMPETGTGNPQ